MWWSLEEREIIFEFGGREVKECEEEFYGFVDVFGVLKVTWNLWEERKVLMVKIFVCLKEGRALVEF